MADLAGTYVSPYTSPTFTHRISYSEIGRDGNGVGYRVTIESWMSSSSSSFGYSLAYNLTINGVTVAGNIKGTETWTGTAVHTTTVDNFWVTAPTGGGQLSARLYTYRPGGEGNSGRIDTGDRTVNVSSWNTPPYLNGAWFNIDQGNNFAENVTRLNLSWGGISDNEGNTLYHTVKRYINGQYSATIANNVPNLGSCYDDIGGGNEGTSYQYSVEINDNMYWANSAIWSPTITKNSMGGASLSTSSSISYATTSVDLNFSGASNTNGNGSFTYSLSCSNVTLYNGTVDQSSPITVTVYKSGTLPTGPYIRFDDIKSVTSGNSYTGTFTFTLTTSNAYGSSRTSTCTMWIDLRTNPTGLGGVTTSGYYTINATNYYITNRRDVTISWSAATDPLGGSITYELQGKLSAGSFTTLKTGLTSTSTTASLGLLSGRPNYTFRVVAKTSYGYYTTADSLTITIDFYNPPSVNFTGVTRTTTAATTAGTVSLNTSITGANAAVSSIAYSTMKTGSAVNGNLTAATSFSLAETGLTETSTYNITFTVQDTIGAVVGTGATVAVITVQRYTPALSIREYGVGVNAFADASYKFRVGGKSQYSGSLTFGQQDYTTITSDRQSERMVIVPPYHTGGPFYVKTYDTASKSHLTFSYGAGTELFSIRNDGGISMGGMGYYGPASAGHTGLTLNSTGTTGETSIQMGTGTGTNFHIVKNYVDSKHGLRIYSGNYGTGSFIMGIMADGKIGIGTGVPTYQLHTTEKVRFGGVKNYGVIDTELTGDTVPNTSIWGTTTHLILTGGSTAVGGASYLGFHQPNSRVDFIKASYGQIEIGWNGGWGNASVKIRSELNVQNLRFDSAVNPGSDYGYLIWYDNNDTYAFWGSTAENGALVLGVENDGVTSSSDVVVLRSKAAAVIDAPKLIIMNESGQWSKLDATNSVLSQQNMHFATSALPGGDNACACGQWGWGWNTMVSFAYGQASEREKKYDIQALDTANAYNRVKGMQTYMYRHKPNLEYAEDGEEGKTKRVAQSKKDFFMGVMIDEAPTEIIDHDEYKTVNLYSYSTIILSALQETIRKVEELELEVVRLGGTI